MTMSQHSTPPSVLFVGCGQVSTEVGHHLVSAGAKVYGLRRNPSILPDTFHQVPIDLLEPVDQPLPNVDAMVITPTPPTPSVEGRSEERRVGKEWRGQRVRECWKRQYRR